MQQQAFVDLEEFLGGARQISISKYVLLNKIVLDRMNTSCKYPKVAKYQRIFSVFCFVAYSEAAALRQHCTGALKNYGENQR